MLNSSSSRGNVATVIDPICKMELKEKEAKFKTDYQGKTYYFCRLSCKKKFDTNPKKYLEL